MYAVCTGIWKYNALQGKGRGVVYIWKRIIFAERICEAGNGEKRLILSRSYLRIAVCLFILQENYCDHFQCIRSFYYIESALQEGNII